MYKIFLITTISQWTSQIVFNIVNVGGQLQFASQDKESQQKSIALSKSHIVPKIFSSSFKIHIANFSDTISIVFGWLKVTSEGHSYCIIIYSYSIIGRSLCGSVTLSNDLDFQMSRFWSRLNCVWCPTQQKNVKVAVAINKILVSGQYSPSIVKLQCTCMPISYKELASISLGSNIWKIFTVNKIFGKYLPRIKNLENIHCRSKIWKKIYSLRIKNLENFDFHLAVRNIDNRGYNTIMQVNLLSL